MGEALEAASALSHGAYPQGEGLSMLVCPPLTILRLEGRRGGVADLALPGSCMSDGAGFLLSMGPDVYLRLGPEPDLATQHARFNAVVDVSSAWTHFAFAGPKAVELLCKGCAVDLHPRMFPAGACCATGFARMRVVLWRPGMEARYEMLVGRSYAQSLWHWLIDAAAQYGVPPRKECPP